MIQTLHFKKIQALITGAVAAAVLILTALPGYSQQQQTREEYIEKYKDAAIQYMKTHGIPASITLAQGCLESANGNSDLAVRANNHFGIKCHNDWKGPTYYKKGDDPGKSCFDLQITDYKGWSHGLKKAGYATDPKYAQKLIKIIEDYQLYRFDREIYAKAEKKPDLLPPSPSQLQQVMELNPAKNSLLYKYSRNRTIYVRNGVPFILAGDLDTYESIAEEYNLFTGELLRFNDLKKSRDLVPGTVVYLQRKKGKAQKHLEIHIAVEGDTYYDVSQKYGVRMKKLFKYNDYKSGDILHIGDEIFLRRHR